MRFNTEDYPHETSLRWTRTATCGSSCREKNSISHRSRPSGFVARFLLGYPMRSTSSLQDGLRASLKRRLTASGERLRRVGSTIPMRTGLRVQARAVDKSSPGGVRDTADVGD